MKKDNFFLNGFTLIRSKDLASAFALIRTLFDNKNLVGVHAFTLIRKILFLSEIRTRLRRNLEKIDIFLRTRLRRNLVSLKPNYGFTLIEMLVVTSILGFVVIMGSNLFFSIMKGSNKSEAIKEVKQNGDYAMEMISRMVRSAKSVTCVGTNNLQITAQDNINFYNLKCEKIVDVFKIATVSASGSTKNYLTGNSVNVVATKNDSACSLSFDCGVPDTPSQKVTVSYTLFYYGLSKGNFVDESSSLKFESTIQLRNY